MLLSQALREFDLSRIGRATSTRQWYQRMLRDLPTLLHNPELHTITVTHLRQWHQNLDSRDLSPHTVRAHLRACRIFFTWCHEEQLIEANPARRLSLPPEPQLPPKAITIQDINALLTHAQTHRDRAIILFLADTACRVAGLCGLQLHNLDIEHREALVKEKGRGGNLKARYVFFGETTANALAAWLQVRPDQPHDHLFTSQRGPLSESGVYQALKRIAQHAGVARFNPHAFRHGALQAALEHGADITTISQLAGHSSIQITHKFYARWQKTELKAQHAKHSWISNGEDETT